MNIRKILSYWPHFLAIANSVVFLDSLRFKFSNAPETQEIFGRLDAWAGSLGAPGLFGHTGLFSQYVIGGAEFVASALLLLGILPVLRRLQGLGALLGLAIMTGATSFHLFTPLGVEVNDDGGALFVTACFVWLSCAILIFVRRREILSVGCGIFCALAPRKSP